MRVTKLALALLLVVAPAGAQPRVPGQARGGCAVTHRALVITGADSLDPDVAPQVVLTEQGALVAFRDRVGALRLARLDARVRESGRAREVARAVGAFSLARAEAGAALVWVERSGEVVLARVSPENEAQNVPRVVARARGGVDAVALTKTPSGLLVVWRAVEDRGVWVLPTDPAGVPTALPRRVAEGASPRLGWLSGMRGSVLVVAPVEGGGEPSVWLLGDGGETVTTARWPEGAGGPVGLGLGAYAVALGAAGQPSLVRISSGELAVGEVLDGGHELEAVAAEGGYAAVLVRARRGGRELLARLTPDAPTDPAPVVVRPSAGSPGALAVRGDGVVFVLSRAAGAHGGARLDVAEAVCGGGASSAGD